jgi:hypothetical protein
MREGGINSAPFVVSQAEAVLLLEGVIFVRRLFRRILIALTKFSRARCKSIYKRNGLLRFRGRGQRSFQTIL